MTVWLSACQASRETFDLWAERRLFQFQTPIFVQSRRSPRLVGTPVLIPFVNFIVWIILCIDVAKSFGKGAGFGIGLLLLPIIFFPILGFGSAQYQGPAAEQGLAVRSQVA